jgi:hypothetical protein
MAKRGYYFENFIRQTLIQYFYENHINAYVRREYQNIPNFSGTDITVDSPEEKYRVAIECKSRMDMHRYNIGSLFKNEQFDRISRFLELSGRRGFLAIQARRGRKSKVFFVRWDEVGNLVARGQPSFVLFDVNELPRPVKKDEVPYRELKKGDNGEWNVKQVLR